MAIILNLETATTNCSVSIARDGGVIFLKEYDSNNFSHAEQLHNFIIEVLQKACLSISDIDAIAVSKGPGSYTGLRIGVSAAKGLCFSLDKPLISIPTLESMAHQLKIKDGYIIPVLDARRMEVYSKVFDANYNVVRDTEAEIIDASSFSVFSEKEKVYIVGSGAEKCVEVLKHKNFNFDVKIVPSAKEMCQLSFSKYQAKDFEDVAYFEPFYLKDFLLLTKKKA